MASIDIGYGAVDGDSGTGSGAGFTCIDLANPANLSGTLTSFEVWALSAISSLKIGTFSGSGTNYTSRDVENIGAVSQGSKQTFTGKNCDVVVGDYIGDYIGTSGLMERFDSGKSGMYYIAGDQFGTGQQTYTLLSGASQCTYATGTSPTVPIPITMHNMQIQGIS